MFKFLISIILLFATNVYGQACGKGSLLTCPAPDADGDGYTTNGTLAGFDCDDTNWHIFPGVWRFSGGLYSQCQTSGSWGTGAAIPDGSTGSGSDYFIDCDAVSNGSGTHASPWNSLAQVSSMTAAVRPVGWVALNDGDQVWISGTCDEELDFDNNPASDASNFYLYGVDGSALNPIRINQWPGRSQAVIDSNVYKSYIFNIEDSSYIYIDGLRITGLGDYGLSMIVSDFIKSVNIEADHVDGEITNNNAGVAFTGTNNSSLTRSKIHNNYDTTVANSGQTLNLRNVVLFQGTGNDVSYNELFMSDTTALGAGVTPVTAEYGACVGYKHGDTVTTNSSTWNVSNNIIFGCAYAVETGEAGSHVHHNYAEYRDHFFDLRDIGGPYYPQNNLVEYNTAKGPGLIKMRHISADSVPNNNIYRHNVHVANRSAYTSEIGTVSDGTYDDETAYDEAALITAFDYRTNCYWNLEVAPLTFLHFNAAFTHKSSFL